MAAISQMKKEDLMKYAEEEFGYQFPDTATRDEIIAGINAMKEGNSPVTPVYKPTVDEPVEKDTLPEAKVPEGKDPDDPRNHPRVKIIIHRQDNMEGHFDVKLNVNGIRYRIQRDKEVCVPVPVVEVLKNAVYTKMERGPDGEVIEQDVNRFNYQVLGPCDE